MATGDRLTRIRAAGLDPARLTIEPLDRARHDRGAFSRGEPSLDTYLRRKARQDSSKNLTRRHVLVPEPGGAEILGYHTLVAHTIDAGEAPARLSADMGGYKAIPAILLGRLAVATPYQSTGLGTLLLQHAMLTSLEISYQVGARSLVVDALHTEAATYYARFGFEPVGLDPLRLHLPMRTIARANPRADDSFRLRYGASTPLINPLGEHTGDGR